jgi:hypothetical protein
MKKWFVLMLFVSGAVILQARTWTSTDGRTVDATVVKVDPDRTVILKTRRGNLVTVPFETFIDTDIEQLDYLLARRLRGKLHPVPWEELNQLFGLNLWQDDYLWDDPTEAAADRIALEMESKTAFMENYRAYPLGDNTILNEPVFSTALYGGTAHVESLTFVFLNQGDLPILNPIDAADRIEESGMRLHEKLKAVLGEPKRDSLGRGDLREKVWRWDWNHHAIMLSIQEGKYAAIRIMPSEQADRAGRVDKLKSNELKTRMAACVQRRENGDVIIQNIPMIDQGPKGYCSPATWERYLRYIEIPADMYLLALAGKTGVGGGTYMDAMVDAIKPVLSSNGREIIYIDGPISPDSIAEYIDQGLPIMWRFISTPSFQYQTDSHTAKRQGKEEPKKKMADQNEATATGGHICLIIGYNALTDEIAISDSWGPHFAERWVDLKQMSPSHRTIGSMNVIKW